MRTVHVGVRHDDDFAVATLGKIRFASVPDAKGGNHTLNFFILQNAHVVRLVGVDNLTAQGKDRLKFANTSAFRRTARGRFRICRLLGSCSRAIFRACRHGSARSFARAPSRALFLRFRALPPLSLIFER